MDCRCERCDVWYPLELLACVHNDTAAEEYELVCVGCLVPGDVVVNYSECATENCEEA